MTDDDPDECGDDATELFNDLESRRSTTSSIPLFASDAWDPFKKALKKKNK